MEFTSDPKSPARNSLIMKITGCILALFAQAEW